MSSYRYSLWLCHNELQNIEDMSSIAKSINLKEITIENNPISLAGDCVSFLVSYLPMLVALNQLQITEQVRRAANAWRRSKENSDQNFQHLSTDVSSHIRREEIISNARTNWELIRSQQATIINGSQRQNNQIKKSTIATKLTPHNSSSSTSSSNVENGSGVGGSDGKMKNGTERHVIDVSKRQKPKLVRSSSHENTSSIVSEKEIIDECDYFHLPPVLGQHVDESINNPSASSMRPNIDSESSAFSSDTDDQKSCKSQIPTTPPINPVRVSEPSSPIEIIIKEDNNDCEAIENKSYTPPLPPIETQPVAQNIMIENIPEPIVKDELPIDEPIIIRRAPTPIQKDKPTLTIVDSNNGISLQPTINIEPDQNKIKPSIVQMPEPKIDQHDADKLSTTSKASAKTSSESINTISSANEERQVHSSHTNYHSRNRSGVSNRKLGPPLIRSQTARNLSSHMNNQQQTGASSVNQGNGNPKKESKKEIDKDREQGERKYLRKLSLFLP